MATPTYTPIETYTLGSAASTVTFGSGGTIPQTYTDLILVFSGSNSTTTQYFLQMGNGSIDTGSNYSTTLMDGNGSTAVGARYSNDTVGIRSDYYATGGGNIKNSVYHIQNYSNTTTYKTCLVRSNLPATEVIAAAGLWRSTSAINILRLTCTSGNFDAGSTFTLYGIANAAIGAPKATGGIITYDNTYYYHTFGASGTFTPQQNLTNVDYLVIAGGGGAPAQDATNNGGAGGAGGLRSTVDVTGGGGTLESKISLTSGTAYTVTVGAGGVGYANGVNSSIAGSGLTTITSLGGGAGGLVSGGIGQNGGSGGGGSTFGDQVGGSGEPNQGYGGGAGKENNNYPAGAGGGAGGVGQTPASSTSNGANGGIGVSIPSIANTTGTGVATYYAGGGGGGSKSNAGVGGAGGGGNGSTGLSGATNGITNTGGGAGANGATGNKSTVNGGSGLVVIRYAKA